jgi:hypothetical protein
MPAIAAPIVRQAVNHHINLDIAGHLAQYHGPVTIIRRLKVNGFVDYILIL